MKLVHQPLAFTLALLLAGCGGGSSSDSTGPVASVPPAASTPQPAPTTITNPLTGNAAPGAPTNIIRGTALAGSTVAAYSVQPDGTSGPALGPASGADINGYFTLTLNQAPLGMVRLVAMGGSTTRKPDNTVQPFDKLELITPFVTTAVNQFHITPLTDIAASAMTYQAKNGATLVNAFVGGMQNMLSLDSANIVFINDKTVYLNVLRGTIKSDVMYYGAQSENGHELLTGLERLGILLDLPAKEVVRAVGQAAQGNYASGDVDGSGKPINVGTWVNGKFDPSALIALKTLRDAKTPSQLLVVGPDGRRVAPSLSSYVSKYMVMDVILDSACNGGGTSYLLSRYPFYQLTSQATVNPSECSAVAARLNDLSNRVATNNSTQMK